MPCRLFFQGSLYLEELEEQSPLEMCYLLGKLQEKGAYVGGWGGGWSGWRSV